MTPEEHQAQHVRLHLALDELLACYLSENIGLGLTIGHTLRTSIHDEIYDLMRWSHEKTKAPSPAPE